MIAGITMLLLVSSFSLAAEVVSLATMLTPRHEVAFFIKLSCLKISSIGPGALLHQ
jgi:hypothetical protein